jgi:transcriptional regulator GlxA family with amidase domain
MSQIALETGFCSQSHFNKVFKEKTGQTPIAYRRALLEQY